MAIVVHMHPSVTRKRPYGATQALAFLENVVPAAPDVPIQIAHLAGAGGYDEPETDQALSVFVDAIRNQDKRIERVYFDVSGVAGYGQWEGKANIIAGRIRALGVDRVLYGSDGSGKGNLSPHEAWTAFRKLPLSEKEFQTIEKNISPYMR
jgi:predicted TIM-barrel fold metal-dependent hydrolase